MAYFPFFMDLSQREGLSVGGTVALRKAEKLLPYAPRLTVCAPGCGTRFWRRPWGGSERRTAGSISTSEALKIGSLWPIFPFSWIFPSEKG